MAAVQVAGNFATDQEALEGLTVVYRPRRSPVKMNCRWIPATRPCSAHDQGVRQSGSVISSNSLQDTFAATDNVSLAWIGHIDDDDDDDHNDG